MDPFTSGAGVALTLTGNAVDVGITNPISLANAVEHGLALAFFACVAVYNPEQLALCVASDSSIHIAKDLDGKTRIHSTLSPGWMRMAVIPRR